MDSAPHLVEEFQGVLQVYSDGSVVRSTTFPFHIPIHDDGSVVWKDSLFHQHHNLHLRIYKPAAPPTKANLPIFYYFHGGGFCVGSRTWPNCHNCCLRLASGLGALVVAPDFRLAPEHRLPAAVEDAVSSLKWLQGQAISEDYDAWLSEGVDLDRVFVVGDSSGGNMAHQVAVQMGAGLLELEPVRIRGFVLMAPFFGGTVRTRSEEGPNADTMFNLELFDRFWRLSIPEGGTADHPLVNPFGPSSPSLEPLELDPILVVVGGNEVLKDRAEQYAKRLKDMGKGIEYVEFKGEGHGFFLNDPFSEAANALLLVIKRFITQNSY